ncbi:MAG: hypothetical protein ACPGKS_03330 [Coraliomargarita sp.]
MILRVLLALAFTSASLTAADVLLRLAPDTHSRIITRLDSSQAALQRARPVKDPELAAAGWQWTEVKATVTGHIPTGRLAKDFSIQPGTIIRASASTTARVLSVVEADDQIDVDTITATAEWTRVRFSKPVPVYFLKSALPATTAMDVPAAPTRETGAASYTDPNELPPETVAWKRIEVDSIYDPQPFEKKRRAPTILVQESIPITPAPKPTPEPTKPQALVDDAAANQRSAPQRPQASNTVGTITLQGVLTRKYTEGAPYSLQLQVKESPRTYVDISKVFINDLRPYLNEPVEIRGTVRPLVVGSEERVLQVHQIRIAH